MANLFPFLPGLTYSKKRTPAPGITIINQSASGKEVPYAIRSGTTIWTFEFTYSVLRAARGLGVPMFGRYANVAQVPNISRLYNVATLTENELAVLQGFFAAQQGAFGRFYLNDGQDNTAGLYRYGGGNGVTTTYQTTFNSTYRALFPSTLTFYIDQSGYGALSTNSFAVDSAASIDATGLITRTSPAQLGQPLYTNTPQASQSSNYYLGEQFGTGDGTTTTFQLTRTIGGVATGYAEPMQNINGAPTIFVNGVKKTVTTDYTVGSTGIVTFTSAPANNAVLSWSGKFYFYVRFADDTLMFEQFMSNLYSNDLKAISILQ
jgi:hypothetical protein